MKTILCYGLRESEKPVFEKVAGDFKICLVPIYDEDLAKTFAQAVEGTSGFGQTKRFEEEWLLCSDMTNQELVGLIHALKENGLEYEGIKVMRNSENENLPLEQVLAETKEAHTIYRLSIRLQQVMMAASAMDSESLRSDQRINLQGSLMNAYLILNDEHKTAEQLESAMRLLTDDLKACKAER